MRADNLKLKKHFALIVNILWTRPAKPAFFLYLVKGCSWWFSGTESGQPQPNKNFIITVNFLWNVPQKSAIFLYLVGGVQKTSSEIQFEIEKLCSQRKNYNFSNQPRRFAKIVCNRIVRVVFGPKKIPLIFISSITKIEKKCAIEYWRCLCLFHNWMIVRVGYAPREVCRDLPKSSERTKGAKRRSSDGAGTASGKNDNSHQTNS